MSRGIVLLAAGKVTGRFVNRDYFTIGKGGSVEARSLLRVFVEPEADRVLRLHVGVLLVSIGANAAVVAPVRIG